LVISYIYSTCWHMKSTFYERQHRATIDVAAGIIKPNISGKEETFTFKPRGPEQCNRRTREGDQMGG
jgi:hypothetical protein